MKDYTEGRGYMDDGRLIFTDAKRATLSPYWLLILALLAVALLPIWGCASNEAKAQICVIQPIGRTAEGFTVVVQSCESPEDFEKEQQGERL